MNKISKLLEDVKYDHVREAVEKFKKIGRGRVLKEYGFRKARTCWLFYEGRKYDSKAIIGVAYRIANGHPLAPKDFSGGDPVLKKLRELGFECQKKEIK